MERERGKRLIGKRSGKEGRIGSGLSSLNVRHGAENWAPSVPVIGVTKSIKIDCRWAPASEAANGRLVVLTEDTMGFQMRKVVVANLLSIL